VRREDREQAALIAAVLCALGALFCLPAVFLEDGTAPIRQGQAGVAAAVCAVLGVACFTARRSPVTWPLHLALLSGITLNTWVVISGGGGVSSASSALVYVWFSIYGFAYFGPRAGAAYAAMTTAQFSGALVAIGETALLPIRVLITMGTITAAGAVVGVLKARIQRLAETDSLTGLPNRRAYEQALHTAVARSGRRGGPLTIALLDLDGFKKLNDTSGHEAGDLLLCSAASAWQRVMRRGDVLARLGGDEFVVVLPNCSLGRAREVTQRLVDVTPASVTTSVGVAIWNGSEAIRETVKRADDALYRAKRTRPGSVAIGSPSSPSPQATSPTAGGAVT